MSLPSFVSAEFFAAFMACAFFASWFWFKWRGEQREQTQSTEPRHIPSIDAKIEARVATTEERFGEEIRQVHGRISGLRDEVKGELRLATDKMEAAAQRMQDTYSATVEKIGGVSATLDQLNQRQHSCERKVDNHIANK